MIDVLLAESSSGGPPGGATSGRERPTNGDEERGVDDDLGLGALVKELVGVGVEEAIAGAAPAPGCPGGARPGAEDGATATASGAIAAAAGEAAVAATTATFTESAAEPIVNVSELGSGESVTDPPVGAGAPTAKAIPCSKPGVCMPKEAV